MTNAKRKPKSESEAKAKKTSDQIHLASSAPLESPQAMPAAAVTETAEPEAQHTSGATEAEEVVSYPLGNAPIHKARLGRVQIAIWVRQGKTGTVRFSVKLSRSYKTEKGFRDTSSLGEGDIANAILLLTQAQELLPPAEITLPIPEE